MKNKSKFIQPKLKEYDNFKKLITNFIKKKYKYVSYVIGGFEKIHEESVRYNIPLLNHDDNCYLCKKKNKRKKDSFTSGILKNKSVQNFFSFGKNKKKESNNSNEKAKNSNTNANKNINKTNSTEIDKNKEKKGFFSNLFNRKKSQEEKKETKNTVNVPLTKYKFNKETSKFEVDKGEDDKEKDKDLILNKSEIDIKSKIFY